MAALLEAQEPVPAAVDVIHQSLLGEQQEEALLLRLALEVGALQDDLGALLAAMEENQQRPFLTETGVGRDQGELPAHEGEDDLFCPGQGLGQGKERDQQNELHHL